MPGPANRASDLELGEHIEGVNGGLKRVASFGYDGTSYQPLKTNSDGELVVNLEPTSINLEGVGNLTVGTTEVEIVITGTPKNIRMRADTTNTGDIYIGKTGVLSNGTNDFVRLESGDELTMSYDDTTNALYAISDTASQVINIGALL